MGDFNDEIMAHFDSPPVVEVIAGVAFEGLGPNDSPLLAAFWKERLRAEFPTIEVQPPYQPQPEQYPAPVRPFGLQFEVGHGAMLNRLWASSADGNQLIQLQPGWFACNWRKITSDDKYDHWPKRRDAFVKWYSQLFDFVHTEGAGVPKVTQAEVTYVNHIVPQRLWTNHADFEKIFTVSIGASGKDADSKLEQITANATFVLDDGQGPYGRLHAKILPAFGRDGISPLYVFELTARGRVEDEGVAGVEAFFGRSRRAVVETFLNLTTPQIQTEWGRKQ